MSEIKPAYLLVTRDDDDIILHNLNYYYSIGLRAFFILLHMANKETIDKIEIFRKSKDDITTWIVDDNDNTYKKDIHFNQLSDVAKGLGFNWHIATDTDELLVLRKHESINDFIEKYNSFDSLEFKWFNYCDKYSEKGSNIFREWKYKNVIPLEWNKAIVKWNKGFSWAAGQHHVCGVKSKHIVDPRIAFYAHFPYRSFERWKKRRIDFAFTKHKRFKNSPDWEEWNKYCFYDEITENPNFLFNRWEDIKSEMKDIDCVCDPVYI